jgi:hypothetical protein
VNRNETHHHFTALRAAGVFSMVHLVCRRQGPRSPAAAGYVCGRLIQPSVRVVS